MASSNHNRWHLHFPELLKCRRGDHRAGGDERKQMLNGSHTDTVAIARTSGRNVDYLDSVAKWARVVLDRLRRRC